MLLANEPLRCALILLAAGASRRLGRPKQLLTFNGRSLLRHAAETALASRCRPIVVVLGCSAHRMRYELGGLPVKVIINPHWAQGMASSIRASLAAVAETAEAGVFMLCDQPLITAGMLDRMVALHRQENRGIVASEYDGALGVPALFARRYFSELAALEGDRGARSIIVKHRDDAARLALPEAAFDVDQAEEVARLEKLSTLPPG